MRKGSEMADVRVLKVFERLELGAGASGEWFVPDLMQNATRAFTAVPSLAPGEELNDADKLVEVTRVYHLLKGASHAYDGSGGSGTFSAYITVVNLDNLEGVIFDMMMSEVF